MILSSFSYARSEFLIHKTNELKAISLGNPKILIQNFQVNKKLIKTLLGKGSVIKPQRNCYGYFLYLSSP